MGGEAMTEERFCPECIKDKIETHTTPWNGVYGPGGSTHQYDVKHNGIEIPMKRISPICVLAGGYIWQCPICKIVVSDWVENK
jgi:hypothetical protein